MSVTAQPLSDALGVEISGLDLTQPVGEADAMQLQALLDAHQLLVVRSQGMSAQDQVRLLSIFGKVSDEGGDGSMHNFVSNVLPDGLFGEHELIFHSDFAFVDYQPPVISLYGIDVGKAAGPTSFASCVRACADLPAGLRARLEGRTVVQVARFAGGNSAATTDNRARMLGLKDMPADSNYRMCRHPVLKPHPRTGVPLLFVSQKHTSHIEGFECEESDAIVKDLLARLYAPGNTYTHHWSVGDLVVWDNVATQHARPAVKGGGAAQRRTLRRVVVSDKTSKQLLGGGAYGSGDG